MKKAVVALGIAAGLGVTGVVGASAWTGRTVGQRLSQQTHEMKKVLPSFEVVEEKLEHGLFSSTRQVTVKLGCFPTSLPALPGLPSAGAGGQPSTEPLQVSWRDEIKHGPFLGSAGFGAASIESKLLLPTKWKAKSKELTGSEDLLKVHSVVGFDGKVRGDLSVPGVKVAEPELGRFESRPITAKFETSAGDAKSPTPYTFEIPQIDFTSEAKGEQFAFKVSGIKAQGVMQPATDGALWLRNTQGTGTVASMEFSGKAPSADGTPGTPFKAVIDQASFSSESKVENDLFSAENAMSLRAKVNDFQIDKIETKSALHRLHAPTYQALMKQVMDTFLSCDAAAQQQAFAQLFADIQARLPELLLHDPEYAFDNISVELGGQRASLSYSFGTKGITKSDLSADAPLLPVLAQKAVAKAAAQIQLGLIERAIKAALAMVEGANSGTGAQQAAAAVPGMPAAGGDPTQMMALVEMMIGQAAAAGYVVREGDLIKSSAAVANGELSVNGKALALPNLGDLPTGSPLNFGP